MWGIGSAVLCYGEGFLEREKMGMLSCGREGGREVGR